MREKKFVFFPLWLPTGVTILPHHPNTSHHRLFTPDAFPGTTRLPHTIPSTYLSGLGAGIGTALTRSVPRPRSRQHIDCRGQGFELNG